MRRTIFTLCFLSCLLIVLISKAQDDGTGISWGSDFFASSSLVLDENFQGFSSFHSDDNPDSGNSNNTFDNDGVTIVPGYKEDVVEVALYGSETAKIKYDFYQCAFAPDWKCAFAYKNDEENTANVSNGFVEISRTYSSTPPTVEGYFEVDLSALEYVDGIQWSHSSCGGNKRGVMLLFSTDDGATWDTLRYQPGSDYNASFTKDVSTGVKTSNTYRCQPSAYGMTWEEGIYYTGKLKLKFGVAGGQVPRIHDLKVYGDIGSSAVNEIKWVALKIYNDNRKVKTSAIVDLAVFNINGQLIAYKKDTNCISLNNEPNGVYLVKAKFGNKTKTAKVVLN